MYGEAFSLDDLDEEVSTGLIKNEIINQKTLISHAKDLGLMITEKSSKFKDAYGSARSHILSGKTFENLKNIQNV